MATGCLRRRPAWYSLGTRLATAANIFRPAPRTARRFRHVPPAETAAVRPALRPATGIAGVGPGAAVAARGRLRSGGRRCEGTGPGRVRGQSDDAPRPRPRPGGSGPERVAGALSDVSLRSAAHIPQLAPGGGRPA